MTPRVSKVAGLVAMGLATAAMGAEVEVVRAFEGNRGPGWKEAADLGGAVGKSQVAALTEGGFIVQDKGTGKVLQKMSPREFWNHVQPAKGVKGDIEGGGFDPRKEANDPRLIYDPLADRWVACEAGTGPETKTYLAVSATGDATGVWRGVTLPVPPKDPGVRLGSDKNGVYVCAYNGLGLPTGMNVYAIPKADAMAADGPEVSRMTVLEKLEFPLAAGVDGNAEKAADAPYVLMTFDAYSGAQTDELHLYKVRWEGGKAKASEKQVIKLGRKYLTPGGPTHLMDCAQPGNGPKLRADSGRRTETLATFGGSVFGANNAKTTKEGKTGIVWYEVRVSDGKVLQEGYIEDKTRDYLFPALAVDGKGNVGIGVTGTSATEFPSIYVMMRKAGDAAGTMGEAVCALKGTTTYRYPGKEAVNWINYPAACVDPTEAGVLWTLHGFSGSEVEKQWCSGWVAYKFKE